MVYSFLKWFTWWLLQLFNNLLLCFGVVVWVCFEFLAIIWIWHIDFNFYWEEWRLNNFNPFEFWSQGFILLRVKKSTQNNEYLVYFFSHDLLMYDKEQVFFDLFKIIRANESFLLKHLELIKLIHEPSDDVCKCLHFTDQLISQIDISCLLFFINVIIDGSCGHNSDKMLLLKLLR